MENPDTNIKKKIILYTAEWCGPCREVKAVLDEMIRGRKDVEVVLVDVDMHPEDGVNLIPRICLINQDEKKCDGVADCVEGAGKPTYDKIRKWLNE